MHDFGGLIASIQGLAALRNSAVAAVSGGLSDFEADREPR